MKCWECKKPQKQVTMIQYLEVDARGEGVQSKRRDICANCLLKLPFNPCHFVDVKKIKERILNVKRRDERQ